jgi:Xaa-Pro dipeptidase
MELMNSAKRIKPIFENSDNSIDAIILKNGSENYIDQNFFYVSGITHGLFEECYAILFPDGGIHLIITELEESIARKSTATIHLYKSKKELNKIIKELLRKKSQIGINSSGLLYCDYQKITTMLKDKKLHDFSKSFQLCRMIKDKKELQNIAKACEIADRVMENMFNYIKINMSENDLAAEIDYYLQKFGAQHPAFNTIASFGPHTAIPHHTHNSTLLKKGDFIVCDFGATYKKYNSDLTRTFVFGKASKKQKEMYETVKKAQEKAISTIKIGIKAHTIHKQVKTFIDKTPYKNHFIHSTGHSLGLSTHDPGVAFNSTCKVQLRENMVLTVEPGIYIQGYGGVRLEDDIVISKNGCKFMTQSSKSLNDFY